MAKLVLAAIVMAMAAGAAQCQAPAQPATSVVPPAVAPSAEQPFIKPATIDDALEVTGDSVAAKQINTRMLIGVEVNGQGPFNFFVDSGADRTVVGEALAQRLGLPSGPAVMLNSMSGAKLTPTVRIDTLRVGSSVVRDIAAPPLPERFLAAQGLVGIDALADQRLNIDFERKRVTVQDTHRSDLQAGPDEVVVVARRRKGQLILTQAVAGGTNVAAVIDTGTEITVGNSALRAKLLRRGKLPFRTATLMSVTGESFLADLIQVPELKIGSILFRGVTIAFVDVPPFKLFGLQKEPAIMLGTDVLEGFARVSLDFRRRRVRFSMRHGSR
jgi:predicted aspartyl protease